MIILFIGLIYFPIFAQNNIGKEKLLSKIQKLTSTTCSDINQKYYKAIDLLDECSIKGNKSNLVLTISDKCSEVKRTYNNNLYIEERVWCKLLYKNYSSNIE